MLLYIYKSVEPVSNLLSFTSLHWSTRQAAAHLRRLQSVLLALA